MLRKGVYSYEYMDNWERFNETSLPSKGSFYSNLNMEDIDDIDYRHGNNVFNKLQLNNLGDYQGLYVPSDTLLLADVFENFRDMCLKEYELQSVTKIVRLIPPPPLFNVGCKFACSFVVLAAWQCFFRLGTTLSQGGGGILDNFKQV